MRRATYCSLLLFAFHACGNPGAQPLPTEANSAALDPPSSFARDFAIDQQVTATHRQGSDSFRAVLEKRGDRLVMIGLGPHGGRGFVLTQEGPSVTFESHIPRALPFDPRMMLRDVHRTWRVFDPSRAEHSIGGEIAHDVWSEGRLMSRQMEASEGEAPITIRYEEGLSPDPSAPPPRSIELDNPRYGYRLRIEAISMRPLESL